MIIGRSLRTEEREEEEALCQRNHELLLTLEFQLGIERPVEEMSVKEILLLVGFQIGRMVRTIEELEEMFRIG
jgi:hypothetical protein